MRAAGRVLGALRASGVRDPVLLLDEVDKMGRDVRGDPAAALLEASAPPCSGAAALRGAPGACCLRSRRRSVFTLFCSKMERMEVWRINGDGLVEKGHPSNTPPPGK